MTRKVVIMGAAGRDFHNFNTYFRKNKEFTVVGFTAFQIPNISDRTYPPALAGSQYPKGIPIFPEEQLSELIQTQKVDEVFFSYSDVSYEALMHRAAIANAAGANFTLLGPKSTQIKSNKPVISVCAVRTGCGKSQTSRAIASLLRDKGKKAAVIRHPMPYGNLEDQICQRFETYDDLEKHQCTIEEREEYETHIENGHVVFAGVDYGKILGEAEKEADVILWDGGNNDFSFYQSDLQFVLVDPHRPGHETRYFPGETNLRMADVVVISKIKTAPPEGVSEVKASIAELRPSAKVIEAESAVSADNPDAIKGKRVLIVEDGPTLTHGEMKYGAGVVAARRYGAAQIVDPKPYAVGSIAETFKKYPHVEKVLPAMGYGQKQVDELKETIEKVPCDVILIGTPFDLSRLLGKLSRPTVRITYRMAEKARDEVKTILNDFLKSHS